MSANAVPKAMPDLAPVSDSDWIAPKVSSGLPGHGEQNPEDTSCDLSLNEVCLIPTVALPGHDASDDVVGFAAVQRGLRHAIGAGTEGGQIVARSSIVSAQVFLEKRISSSPCGQLVALVNQIRGAGVESFLAEALQSLARSTGIRGDQGADHGGEKGKEIPVMTISPLTKIAAEPWLMRKRSEWMQVSEVVFKQEADQLNRANAFRSEGSEGGLLVGRRRGSA